MSLFRELCVKNTAWCVHGVVVMVMALGVLQGCEAPLPATPPTNGVPVDTANAWAEWQAIAAKDQQEWDLEQAIRLASAMAERPSGLRPMLLAVGDEKVSPQTKVLVVLCLTPIKDVLAPYEAMLTELIDPTKGSGVRTFGAHLLGLLESPEAVAQVTGLLDDPDRSVRESALGVLVALHGDAVTARLDEFWARPDTTLAIREQVILGMAPELVEQHLALFADTVVNLEVSAAARYKSATVLGQAGNASHSTAMERCAAHDPDPYVQERAENGLALLRARAGVPAGDPAAATNSEQ